MKQRLKFDYGHEAVLKETDSSGNLTKRACCVVGITLVETQEQVQDFGYPLGEYLYTVEFSDGTDKLVPQSGLKELSEED